MSTPRRGRAARRHAARSRARRAASPLPRRHGLDALRLRTPPGHWTTLRAYLADRFPRVRAERLAEMLSEGRIVDRDGPVYPDTPFVAGVDLWMHRDLPDEATVPAAIPVLHRDDALVVVDKPHFMATIPRGRHVLQTALVRLRHELDLPDLSPAHRLDRATAGVVMFVIRPELRGAYQTLFRDRRVTKTYEAVAPYRGELDLPRTVSSRIVKHRGVLQAVEEPGPPNAHSRVQLLAHRDRPGPTLGRYRLTPSTGRTHQLRLHMCGLGVPILGDDFYPERLDRPLDDFTRPLQLLATELRFTDPITGADRCFRSRARLTAWDSYATWLG